MKRTLTVLLVLGLLVGTLALPLTGAAAPPAGDEAGGYLILFAGKGVPARFEAKVAKLGGSVDFAHDVGIALVSGLTEATAAKLAKSPGVADVQPNFAIEFDPGVLAGEPLAVDAAPQSPDDPTTASRYSWQWNMRAIDADDAWAAGRLGSSDVTVAILDTGIDYTYPDLDGRVDLSRSISLVPEDDVYVAAFFPGKHPVTDIHYHGTHVAATVASNAYVAAGVTSQTTLIGVKVCSAALGYCPSEAVLQGVLHAVDNGADVINMSLGGGFSKAEYGWYVGVLNRLFNYANRMGVTVVVSAGNDAIDMDHDGNNYKTYCSTPNTVCVSATGPTSSDNIYVGPWYEIDAPASYTNYGRSAINVAAPGGNSGGYVWAACSQTSLVISVCQTGTYIVGLGGTSMAAPHVSGLASLMVEDVGRNPGLVRAIIQQSADDLGQVGTDPFYGKGRINVFNAIH